MRTNRILHRSVPFANRMPRLLRMATRMFLLPAAVLHVAAQTPLTNLGPSQVTVSGRQLLVQRRNLDGTLAPASPYTIHGVCWSPAGTNTATSGADPNNATIRRVEFGKWYQTDIPLLKAVNANTVRTFMDFGFDSTNGPIGLAILDQFYTNGIMVILTVDDANNNTNRIVQAVSYYRSHPAVLMWSLGSEWSVNRYFDTNHNPTLQAAAEHTEQAAQIVKLLDTNHPVVSSYGEMDENIAFFATNTCPAVDVWSFNEYLGASFAGIFNRWAAMSSKPMFLGEFGIDAFHWDDSVPSRALNEAEQKRYDLALWDEIWGNFSSANPTNVCLGGTVFEWCDEWWKDGLWQSQENGGWFPPGFPDGHASEDIFGIVDIYRNPRQAYFALSNAFDTSYTPTPTHYSSFRVISRGFPAGDNAVFYWGDLKFFGHSGGSYARGFSVAALDPNTGRLVQPLMSFDTWRSRSDGSQSAHVALINFLNNLPNGTLLLISVADEAGINDWDACSLLPWNQVQNLLQTLQNLGSTRIRDYCYRSSWAMITYKGDGRARFEGVSSDNPVALGIQVNGTLSISLIPDQSTEPGTPTLPIPFEVDDGETPASNLVVTAASSNPTLVPNTNFTFAGSGVHRTVAITPLAQQVGQTIVTLTVTDGDTNSTSTSFTLLTRPFLFNPRLDQNGFSVSLQTISGRAYTLEFAAHPEPGNWSAFDAVIGNGSVMILTDPHVPPGDQRFYRVRVLAGP